MIEHMVAQPEYAAKKKEKRFVNMYDINELFVKRWTKGYLQFKHPDSQRPDFQTHLPGTGCSLSILMSKHRQDNPKMMFSHAWGEDVEECYAALYR